MAFFGASVLRPFYTYKMFNTEMEDTTISIEDFTYKYINKVYLNPIYDCSEEMYNIMCKEFTRIPGESNLEKYENHYLFHRNGLHFDSSYICDIYKTIYWGILQSKNLIKLKYMLYGKFSAIKLQLDLLYMINPELAKVEISNSNNESDRRMLDEKYGVYPYEQDSSYDFSLIEKDLEDVEKIKKKIKTKITEKIFTEKNALIALNKLIKENVIEENVGITLWDFIKNKQDSRKDLLFVKLISLYFEIHSY